MTSQSCWHFVKQLCSEFNFRLPTLNLVWDENTAGSANVNRLCDGHTPNRYFSRRNCSQFRSRTWHWASPPAAAGIDRRTGASFRRRLVSWSREGSKNIFYVSYVTFYHPKVQLTFLSISWRSDFGLLHDAAASQKKIKSGTTPAGLTVIIWHIPRKAESFSSLSRMLRNEEHLNRHKRL